MTHPHQSIHNIAQPSQGSHVMLKSAYPISITLEGQTYTKHTRGALMPWGELFSLSDDQVHEQLRARLTLSESSIQTLAAFVALNPRSVSFDYPQEDHTRALLGALNVGQLTLL